MPTRNRYVCEAYYPNPPRMYACCLHRSEWLHHCKRAARSLSRADFEPLKTIGKGQWGKVFLVRKTSGPVAGQAAADPGLVTATDNVCATWRLAAYIRGGEGGSWMK